VSDSPIVDSNIAALPNRLRSLGPDRIKEFLQQIPHSAALQSLLRPITPPNKSFRAGSETTIRYQLSQLANGVCGNGTLSEGLVRRIYSKLWVLGADRTLGHHWSHPELLALTESAIPELLRRTQEDTTNLVSREQVRRVLEYAPFELSAQLDAVLALLPSSNEVGFRKVLLRLESKVSNLELTLTELATHLSTLERGRTDLDHEDSPSAELARLGSRITELEERSGQSIATELDAIQSEVAAFKREFDQLRTVTVQQHGSYSEVLSRLVLVEGVALCNPSVSPADPSNQVELGDPSSGEPGLGTKAREESVKPVAHVSESPATDVRSLASAAEKRETRDNARIEAALFPMTSAYNKPAGAVKRQIDTSDALRDVLEVALHDAGLFRQDAFATAARVASGLLATRWITVSGSLAIEFGSAVVRAISGVKYWRSSVPIGCIDVIAPQTEFRCMAVGGADRAPVEVYAGAYRRRTIARIRGQGRADDAIVVAICEGGLSSVPLSATLGCLGPVFATDLMRWNASARAPKVRVSLLSDGLLGMNASAFGEDELDPAILALFSEQPLWLTSLRRFLAVLQNVNPDDSPIDAAIVHFAAPLIASCRGGQVPADIASASQTAGVERHVAALRQ
jgi:hypothetical protein